MVVIHLKGGLGNQLFQYSAGYSLARRLNQEMVIDTSYFKNNIHGGYRIGYLKLQYDVVQNSIKYPLIIRLAKEKHFNRLIRFSGKWQIGAGSDWSLLIESTQKNSSDFFTVLSPNVFVDGYFQSESFFRNYRKELINQFVPAYEQSESFSSIDKKICSTNSVAIHVRRGDFLREKNPWHYVLDRTYYEQAISFISQKIHNPVFFWFSNDIDWVRTNFQGKENYIFVSIDSDFPDIDDLILMSNCRHVISANSTFSWWAAWLNMNEGIVICPKREYGIPEMIPCSWIKI